MYLFLATPITSNHLSKKKKAAGFQKCYKKLLCFLERKQTSLDGLYFYNFLRWHFLDSVFWNGKLNKVGGSWADPGIFVRGGGGGGPGQSDKKKRISCTFSQTCKKETKYNISDITLWKTLIAQCSFWFSYMIYTHKNLNKCTSCQIFSYFTGMQAHLKTWGLW